MPSSIVDHQLICERYLPPRRLMPRDPFWVDCGDARLACHWHAPHTDALTLVHFHGNGEVVADYLSMLSIFDSLGVNLFFAEYRGYGGSSGHASLSTLLADAPRIIEALGLPEQQLVLFGRSVGSLPAIQAADRFPNVAGLILESGIADLPERVLLRVTPEELGVTTDELEREWERIFNLDAMLGRFRRPLLVLHSLSDGWVGRHHADRFLASTAGPKRLCMFEKGCHNTILLVNLSEYLAEVERFCRSLRS